MLKIRDINTFKELQNLKPTWNDALQKSKDNTVFSTWEWLSCWWKHFGEGRQLRVLVAQEKEEILGIAPLMLSRYNFMQIGKIAKIEFLGSPHSDYNNFILLKNEKECIKLMLEYLMAQPDWDFLQLRDVHNQSQSIKLLHEFHTDEQWKLEFQEDVVCPYIALPSSFSVFTSNLGPKTRRSILRQMRKLSETHKVTIKFHKDFKSIQEAMNILFDIHQKRWVSRGELGAFASPAIRSFHVDIAREFAEKDWLYLHFLTVDDSPIASDYSFNYGQKIYGYLDGFDPLFKQYSVGNILKMKLIEMSIENRLKEFDFTRGYGLHKIHLANAFRKNYQILLARKGLFPRIYGHIRKNEVLRKAIMKISKPIKLAC